jgi:hypothetical protein
MGIRLTDRRTGFKPPVEIVWTTVIDRRRSRRLRRERPIAVASGDLRRTVRRASNPRQTADLAARAPRLSSIRPHSAGETPLRPVDSRRRDPDEPCQPSKRW